MQNRIAQLAESQNLSGSELARRLDMHPHAMRRYLRNETQPKSPLAAKIAEMFGVSVEHVLGFGEDASIALGRIPLYGTAEGGLGSDVSLAQAIDHIERPSLMRAAPSAYAVYVVGESMEPRYYAGEIAYVNPTRPVRKGDFVIVQMLDGDDRSAIIKRYISSNDKHVFVEQLNPSRKMQLPKKIIVGVHFVQGAFLT